MNISASHSFPLPDDVVHHMLQTLSDRGKSIITSALCSRQFYQQINDLASKCLTELSDREQSIPILTKVAIRTERSSFKNIKLIAKALMEQGFNPRILTTLNSGLIVEELAKQENALISIIPIIAMSASLRIPFITSIQGAVQWFTDFQIQISQITSLRITNNAACTAIPAQIALLEQLENLVIINCPNLTEIPAEIGKLTHLKNLTLHALPIRTLPNEMNDLQELKELEIDNCSELKSFPTELLKRPLEIKIFGCPLLSIPQTENQKATVSCDALTYYSNYTHILSL